MSTDERIERVEVLLLLIPHLLDDGRDVWIAAEDEELTAIDPICPNLSRLVYTKHGGHEIPLRVRETGEGLAAFRGVLNGGRGRGSPRSDREVA